MAFLSRRTSPAHSKWYADQSANSLPVNRFGGVIQNDEGSGIRSASFNGSTGYLTTTTQNFQSGNSTIEFWMKPTQYSQQVILHCTDSLHIHMMTGGALHINNAVTPDVIMPVLLNVWQHVAVVIDGSSKRVFLDGVLKYTTSQLWTNNNNPLFIGKDSTTNQYYYNGLLTGLRITKGAALYTSDFTPPGFLPTAVIGTTLLMNFRGTIAPGWFQSSSTVANSLSSAGGVTLVDEGFGAKVANFSNSYLQGGSTPDISSGDFTAEFFVKFTVNNIGFQPILARYFPGADNRYSLIFTLQSDNTLALGRVNTSGTPNLISTSFVPQVNVWYHIAVSLVSTAARLFVNGILLASATWDPAYNTSQIWQVGRYQNYSGGSRNFTGRLAGIRVVAGTGLYTTNFNVPTTLPANIFGTQLLTNFTATEAPGMWLNTATTASTYLSAVTPTGLIYPIRTGELITSALFDGSGDFFLVQPSSIGNFGFGTEPFTAEFWVKPLNLTGDQTLLTTAEPSDTTGFWLGTQGDKLRLTLGYDNFSWATAINSTLSLVVNKWYHVALTCTASGAVAVYLNGIVAISTTRTSSLPNINNRLAIGGRTVASQYSNCKMTGIRVVKGTALYTGNFEVPATKVAAWVPNTVLLLNFDSANASPWYRDTSLRTFLPVLSGNTSQNFEDNRIVSAYTNKEGHLLTNLRTTFSTGDFDISFFVKFNNALATDGEHLVWQPNGGLAIFRAADETLRLNLVGIGDRLVSTVSIRDTNWHYVQVKRASSVSTFYIDGVLAGSASDSTTYSASDVYLIPYSQTQPVAAQMAGLRISRSGSLTTTVPTSAREAEANTLLLMNFGSTDVPSLWYGDTSSAHRSVTLSAGVTQVTEGQITAAQFNGTTGFMTAQNSAGLDLTVSDFTIEGWANVAYQPGHTFVAKAARANTSVGSYTTYIHPTLNVFTVDLGGADTDFVNFQTITTSYTPPVGEWFHFAVVRRYSAAKLLIFINGILIQETTITAVMRDNTDDLHIGKVSATQTGYLNGKLAGLRIVKGTALYTSNFSVPTIPPRDIDGTQLLLNFDTTAAPLLWFRDESSTRKPVGLTGGTPTQYDQGNGVRAASFDGASYLTAYSSNNGFVFGTGNWTVEFFVHVTAAATGGDADCWVSTAHTTDWNGIYIGTDSSNALITLISSNGSSWTISLGSPANVFVVGQWHHVAVVVNSGTLSMYVNGISVGSVATSIDIPNVNNRMVIGGRTKSSQYSTSRITGLRVVKGTAVYTSNFNPPAALPTNIPGTELLMDFGSDTWTGISAPPLWYRDTTPASRVVILSGAVTQSNEGRGVLAAAFDGNSSLTINPDSNLNISSSDFTIETWFKINSFDGANSTTLIDKDTIAFASRASYGIGVVGGVGNKVNFVASSTATWGAPQYEIYSTNSITFNTWNHVALTRVVSTSAFRLFLNGNLEATFQLPFAMQDFGRALTLGRAQRHYPNSVLNGKLAGTRIVKGAALYTDSFPLPTSLPTSVFGTELLLNYESTVVPRWYDDASSFNRTVTLNGNIVQTDLGSGVKVAQLTRGAANVNFNTVSLSGQFTMEAFYYVTQAQTNNYSTVFVGASGGLYAPDNTGRFNFRISGGINISSSGSAEFSTWNHIVAQRDSSNVVRLFVNGALQASGTHSGTFDIDFLGGYLNNSGISGNITGARITNTSVYATSGFDVPLAPPTAVTGTQLLLNFGATEVPSVWFADTSLTSKSMRLSGSVTQASEGSGVVAAAFNGSGYLTVSDSITFGAGNFTVELFVNISSSAGEYSILTVGPHNGGFQLTYRKSTNQIYFDQANQANLLAFNAPAGFVDTWRHVAAVRTGTTFVIYVDGISIGSGSNSTNFVNGPLRIGYYPEALPTYFLGRMAGLRVTNTARYAGNFGVPRTLSTAVSGTQLLLNFGATAAPAVWYGDTSSTARLVSLSANVTQAIESDGTRAASFANGALLLSASNDLFDFGTGDFTVDFFVKPDSLVGNAILIDARTDIYTNNSFTVSKLGSTIQYTINNSSGNVGPTGTIVSGWNHIAIVRSSGTSRMYINSLSAAEMADTRNINTISTRVCVGAAYDVSEKFNGRIAGLRVVKGSVLYSGPRIAVPSSPSTAVAGTQLLLNFGTSAVPLVPTWYQDSSSTPRLIDVNGTLTQSDEGNGVKAAEFNSASYLAIASSDAFTFGSGDFTVEFFVKPNDLDTAGSINAWITTASPTDSTGIFISRDATNQAQPSIAISSNSVYVIDKSIVNGLWHHVALVRNGGIVSYYVNGNVIGSIPISVPLTNTNNQILIGGRPDFSQLCAGKITGVRVVKGTAVYSTSAFAVPTTLPTAIAGTQLLLNFSASAAPVVSPWYSDVSLSRSVSPSGTVTQFNGGGGILAANFDGSLDYLSASNINFGTSPFTIEGFFNPRSLADGSGLFGSSNGAGNVPKLVAYLSGGAITVELNNGSTKTELVANASNIALSSWNHIALVRDTSNNSLYINGARVATTAFQSTTGINAPFYIGWTGEQTSFNGLITVFRVVSGTALYSGTSLTTPTILPTVVAGTQLLMPFGANDVPTARAWYDDASPVANVVTLNGTVTRSISDEVVGAASSNAGYLTTGTTTFSGIGTGDFTVEMFIRPNSTGFYDNKRLFSLQGTSTVNLEEGLAMEAVNGSGIVTGGIAGDSTASYTASIVLTQGVWHHLVMSRSSGIVRTYVDGVKNYQATSTGSVPSNYRFAIGAWKGFSGIFSRFLDGVVTGVRVVNTGLYTTDTFSVPTTMPTAIAGTRLLLNFGSTATSPIWVTDTSLTPRSVSLSGTVARVIENNGATAVALSGGVILLNNPSNNLFDFGTGDFTVEFFMKPNSLTGDGVLFDARTNVYVNNSFYVIKYGNTLQYSINNNSGNVGPTGTITADWNHIAIVRSSGISYMYINGLSAAQMADTRNINTISTQVRLGAAYDVALNYNGRIAGVRAVKGTALYSGASFNVPTTLPTAITNTQLLLNFGSTASPGTAPTITAQPFSGGSGFINTPPVTLSVTATGTTPLAYQWYKDNVLINGATTNSYVIDWSQGSVVGGLYKVVVTNYVGSVTSNISNMTFNAS